MPKEDFLKKLQESLSKGEKTEATEYINQIDKLASTLSVNQAAENLDKRINKSEPKIEMNEEDRKNVEVVLSKLTKEQKENDEKLKLLAEIQQKAADIKKLEIEYHVTKLGYEKKLEENRVEKLKLMFEFEKIYGTSANDEYNNQLGTNTKFE